jgi:anti-sigma B factor antagonist
MLAHSGELRRPTSFRHDEFICRDSGDNERSVVMPESLNVEVVASGTVPVLRLRGNLAYGQNLTAIHEAVSRLRSEGHTRLVVDLSAVASIDSSGISALLDVKQTIGGREGRVILLRPSERVRESLAMMRVTSLFEIAEGGPQVL